MGFSRCCFFLHGRCSARKSPRVILRDGDDQKEARDGGRRHRPSAAVGAQFDGSPVSGQGRATAV
jgi:hypothetical protein